MRALFYFILIVILYKGALWGSPIWDDYFILFNKKYFLENKDLTSNIWIVTTLIHRTFYRLFGDQTFAYHFFNILLHFFNVLLFEKLFFQLFKKKKILITLLFLAHPLCVEAVAWMNQSKTLLATTLILLSVIFFTKWNGRFRYVKSYFFLFLSFITKTIGAGVPISFMLLDGHKRRNLLVLMAHSMILLVSFQFGIIFLDKEKNKVTTSDSIQKKSLVRNTELKRSLLYNPKYLKDVETFQYAKSLNIYDGNFPFRYRAMLIIKNFWFYTQKFFLPVDLSLIYKKPTLQVNRIYFIPILLALLIMSLALTRGWLDPNYSESSVLYFVLALSLWLPISGIYSAPFMFATYTADRHLYVIIPFLLISFYYFWLSIKFNPRFKYLLGQFFLFFGAIYFAFYSYQTLERAKAWKSQVHLMQHSLKSHPDSPYMHFLLGKEYMRNKEFFLAEKSLSQAIDIYERQFSRRDPYLDLLKNLKRQASLQYQIKNEE